MVVGHCGSWVGHWVRSNVYVGEFVGKLVWVGRWVWCLHGCVRVRLSALVRGGGCGCVCGGGSGGFRGGGCGLG